MSIFSFKKQLRYFFITDKEIQQWYHYKLIRLVLKNPKELNAAKMYNKSKHM